jgi:hypothetical protein
MSHETNDRLNAWARFINALAGLGSRLLWIFIGLIVIGGFCRFLLLRSPPAPPRQAYVVRVEKTAPEPIPWDEVDKDVKAALKTSHDAADVYAGEKLETWLQELEKRIDEDFLPWYFDYWQQQWLGLKALGYRLEETEVVKKVLGEEASAAERISREIQEEFAARVLQPQIAQMRVERIGDETVEVFLSQLRKSLKIIPAKYRIPRPVWERHLEDIALLTSGVEGNRRISIPLKAITVSGVAVTAEVAKALKPAIERIGSKMAAKAAAREAEEAALKVSGQAGAKVAAKFGGRWLGPIILLAAIAWDLWDHHHTVEVERPILRKSLVEYLGEMKHSLLYEPETGLMSVIHSLELNVVASLKSRQGGLAASVNHVEADIADDPEE